MSTNFAEPPQTPQTSSFSEQQFPFASTLSRSLQHSPAHAKFLPLPRKLALRKLLSRCEAGRKDIVSCQCPPHLLLHLQLRNGSTSATNRGLCHSCLALGREIPRSLPSNRILVRHNLHPSGKKSLVNQHCTRWRCGRLSLPAALNGYSRNLHP
jgi:hypothetical protein